MFRRNIVGYYNDSLAKIEKCKYINKKVIEFLQKYLRGLDKTFI